MSRATWTYTPTSDTTTLGVRSNTQPTGTGVEDGQETTVNFEIRKGPENDPLSVLIHNTPNSKISTGHCRFDPTGSA